MEQIAKENPAELERLINGQLPSGVDGAEFLGRVDAAVLDTVRQRTAHALAHEAEIIICCGRYEGIDARVREGWIDREISCGDFVLTGGEPAALIMLDAVIRLLPDVLGNPDSLVEESFSTSRLDYPHYTRPRSFRGMDVPEVLLSGHHGKIEAWRLEQAMRMTRQRRPDLLEVSEEE